MDSLAERWARLRPHIRIFGPAAPGPTVLLFHGCGGVGRHMQPYAEAAAALGFRAVVVDSYAARGWSDNFGRAFVCTGLTLWGRKRAGDVLAAAWGAVQELGTDPSDLVLAGWSHGAWSIMDLMTMPLERPSEADLADPSPAAVAALRGIFLVYPYGGMGALTRRRPWVRHPRTFAVLAEKDHITSARDSERLYEAVTACGCELEVWRIAASHGFDEPHTPLSPMRYDRRLAGEAIDWFGSFLCSVFAAA